MNRQDVGYFKASQHRSHAAGNVEADPAGRYNTALIGIEGGNAADRKTITPMRIRHHIRSLDDAGQHRDIDRLLVDFVVHVADEIFVSIDDCRDAHCALWLDAPGGFIDAREACRIHRRSPLHVHNTGR